MAVAKSPLDNGAIAELLALEAEGAEGHVQRAYKRAARAALGWPVECADLLKNNEPLSCLNGIGPFLEKRIVGWLHKGLVAPRPQPLRADFMTATEVNALLAAKPAFRGKCRGDLQMHSTWSDGSDNIAAMAEGGLARGYQYIAITDHSQGLRIAGGIDEAALTAQAKEIAAVNRKLQKRGAVFRVLQAMEMNINPDGTGDMKSAALAKLDLVLGSFHSKLRFTDDQTERYVRALMNPDIQVLGHPRGRIFNHRIGLKADWKLVFKTATLLDKAVEIDGYPDRQDLNRDLLKLAKASGVRISLGSDAHNATQLEFLDYSLAAALEAGIPASRIINFMTSGELLAWVATVRTRVGTIGKID